MRTFYRAKKEKMDQTKNHPPARERARRGLLPLDWARAPLANEAWADKITVNVHGYLRWSQGTFIDYLRRITEDRALTTQPTVGRRYRSPIDLGTLKGEVDLRLGHGPRADQDAPAQVGIRLRLYLNPTKTRALVVRRAQSPLTTLNPRAFFAPFPTVEEAFKEGPFAEPDEMALDGSENVLLGLRELGGARAANRAIAREDFMALYEEKLRSFVSRLLCPTRQGLASWDHDGNTDWPNGEAPNLELDWAQMSLSQAEIYFERECADPVGIVMRVCERGMELARSVRTAKFHKPAGFITEIESEFPHLVVPLTPTGNIQLSTYAKTNRRVRFEVRYAREFSRCYRGASSGDNRLSSIVQRLADDAANRLPWRALRHVAMVAPNTLTTEVASLFTEIANSTCGSKSAFGHIALRLVATGGIAVQADEPSEVRVAVTRLVKRGVLERWCTYQKEPVDGRRYGLAHHYAEVRRRMIAGFVPTASVLPLVDHRRSCNGVQ